MKRRIDWRKKPGTTLTIGRALFCLLPLLGAWSCWKYEDPSAPLQNQAPETYLSLLGSDTLYLAVIDGDSLWAAIDTVTFDSANQEYDTVWTYLTGNAPDTSVQWTAIGSALETVTTSRQALHWWGEDPDGYVIGYEYRWNIDSAWTSTTEESRLFFVPIQTQMDVFSFEVIAMDNDSLVDPTPARIVLPIRNSPPAISFRYRSNPLMNPSDTSFTFPTRTFVWDVEDQDGIQTVTDIFYALDDTCDTCWNQLDAASYSSITLTDISVEDFHTFFVKARDVAGAESEIIHFPDSSDQSTPNYWKVMPVVGNVLLVDDFPQDRQNNTQHWYKAILDSVIGHHSYSVWEIGEELPYSSADVNANLNYFDHVIWYSAYTGAETYNEASSSILNFAMGGGNIFLNISDLKDTSFVWFPIDSMFTLNRSGRLFPGSKLHSQIDSTLDLEVSKLIAIRVKGFETNPDNHPHFFSLYRLQEPGGSDEWMGTPNVCAKYQFEVTTGQLSGKVVLMTIPLHNGSQPLLEGNGSASKFIAYLLEEEFTE